MQQVPEAGIRHVLLVAMGIYTSQQSKSPYAVNIARAGSCHQDSLTAYVSRPASKQKGARGQLDLQEEAQLLEEVSLGAPGVPVAQPEHRVAGQGAQQRRPTARPQQPDGGRVEGVQAALELHAQHHRALAVPLLQLPQVLQQGALQPDPLSQVKETSRAIDRIPAHSHTECRTAREMSGCVQGCQWCALWKQHLGQAARGVKAFEGNLPVVRIVLNSVN